MPKKETFGDFTNTLLRAQFIDPRYPSKGGYVWLPDGFSFKENVFRKIEEEIGKQGYRRFQFPRLIPESAIKKVTENVDDFEGGVFWLSDNSGKPFNLFLNPTGECGVYTMFQKWVNQASDLPMRLYQIGTTFRPHTRSDVMLNGDELSNLLEAHSAFATKEDADREFEEMTERLRTVHDSMGIPFLPLRRPLPGNKPVCIDMISFETYLPSKRTSFNVGVHYNQGQIYSKAFDVSFKGPNGKTHTHQVTSGISERGIAAMLDLHKDDQGLRLLPEFSPTQVLVIPVYSKDPGKNQLVNVASEQVIESLKNKYRVEGDYSSRATGKKFAVSRLKGIPIRIGISADDSSNVTTQVYARTREMPLADVSVDQIGAPVSELMGIVRREIVSDASNLLESKVVDTHSIDDTYDAVKSSLIAKMHYCGDSSCLKNLNDSLPGELIGTEIDSKNSGRCLSCGKESSAPSYFSRRGSSP